MHWSKSQRSGFGVKVCEDIEKLRGEDIQFDEKHVKAHRTKKENAKMTLFEEFVTEGNEAADWLAKEGVDLDGGGFFSFIHALMVSIWETQSLALLLVSAVAGTEDGNAD